jgi:Tol biopolymer transport system component
MVKNKLRSFFLILTVPLVAFPFLINGCADSSPGKIAFISDRDEPMSDYAIYVMNADGSNQTRICSWYGYASSSSFCWSPDGKRIAFTDMDGWLCVADADGKNIIKLAELPSFSICWSPDGGKIVAGCLDHDIYIVDSSTGEMQNLTNSPEAIESLPSWSPDGKKLAFVVFNQPYFDINLMDADGTNETKLASECGLCEEIAWSPDGEKISYTWYSEDIQMPEGICRDISVVDTNDGRQINLTDSPEDDDKESSWSPDGTKIVFSSRRQVTVVSIYVMNINGNQLSQLTTGYDDSYCPSWSPDGKKIVYTRSVSQPDREDIYVMDADGSNVINLTDTPGIADFLPVWSPK